MTCPLERCSMARSATIRQEWQAAITHAWCAEGAAARGAELLVARPQLLHQRPVLLLWHWQHAQVRKHEKSNMPSAPSTPSVALALYAGEEEWKEDHAAKPAAV